MTLLLALNEQGYSELLFRVMIEFWELISLGPELSFKHLEERLSLTVSYTEN